MSNERYLAEDLNSLSVHSFGRSDQQLASLSSSTAAAAVMMIPPFSSEVESTRCDDTDAQNMNPQPLHSSMNTQQLDNPETVHSGIVVNETQLNDKMAQLSAKTESLLLPNETKQLSINTAELGFSNHLTLQPNTNVVEDIISSNVDQWVQDLNQVLQKHHHLNEDRAALVSVLTTARQLCNDRAKNLTEEYREHSESILKCMLKKKKPYTTKKQQKKTLKMFDSDLKTVNNQLDDLVVVRQQLDFRLKQLICQKGEKEQEERLHEQKPELMMPILTPSEFRAVAKGSRGRGNFFCRDLFMCLLLSFLVPLLITAASCLF